MWYIDINVIKDLNGGITNIQTVHKRSERLLSNSKQGIKDENLFTFSWEFIINYDIKTLEINKAEMYLKDVNFESDEEKDLFKDEKEILTQTFKNVMNNIDGCKDPNKKEEDIKPKKDDNDNSYSFFTFVSIFIITVMFISFCVFLNFQRK
jgi:hypothetical protein